MIVRYIDGMPKRRPPRRVRLERAAERASMPPAEPVPPRRPRNISWAGVAGGVAGALPLGARGVEILVDPRDVSRLLAIPLFIVAAVYVPAIWVSVARIENRKRVLRNVLAVTLLLLVIATILTRDPGLAVLLLIPSSLLAIAAGVIFEGPRRAR